ncbi:alpha/beta hydrolase [Aurantimonas sp. C2-6-R+9]|uniref:alpha/beta fold hydrolase n=1 Tax=unclassified Aurantimonas TaxID=2638230 RepID=UPI002E19634C|nr:MULTISPECIES: alpha/beta hydrolase [unclassified Aurantimonas]MEC5292122.1 alpha/beta hydrolase [Aurantimonas sp. C2-3-R2]MEC5382640.1 alpha/beta hydrolase [Aurantimonas sp. C2-6-R+9]MEC5413209.1 alpha/beta hydrolase [Aurantimonas sp. C2-4-R8]
MASDAAQRRTIEAGDLTVAYRDIGPKSDAGAPPLLLLHGAVQTKAVWSAQIPALAQSRRIVAPDFRGHGETRGDIAGLSVETLAEDGFRFLDALGIDRVSLGGVSLGGMVALEMAARQPERVEALILADTPLALSLHGPVRSILEALGPQRILSPLFRLFGQRRTARLGIASVRAAFGNKWVGADAERHFIAGFATMPPAAILATYEAIVAADPAAIGALDIPCLVILGDDEVSLVVDHAAEIARRIGRAEIVRVNGGHVANLDAPEAFNEAVVRFLEELPPGSTQSR